MIVLINGVEYSPRIKTVDAGINVGKLMFDGRRQNGLTMQQAADKSGLKVNHIFRAECGSVTLESAVALADAYGIEMEQIASAIRSMKCRSSTLKATAN